MKTRTLILEGFEIRWTADGEHYRYVIMRHDHIYTTASGTSHEDNVQPTEENMKGALQRWIRMTKPAQSEKKSTDG